MLAISDRSDVLSRAQFGLKLPPDVPEWVSPIVAVVAGQLFAHALCVATGQDPDKPRGLSKVTLTSLAAFPSWMIQKLEHLAGPIFERRRRRRTAAVERRGRRLALVHGTVASHRASRAGGARRLSGSVRGHEFSEAAGPRSRASELLQPSHARRQPVSGAMVVPHGGSSTSATRALRATPRTPGSSSTGPTTRANLFVNGTLVLDQTKLVGAYRAFDILLDDFLRPGRNHLALQVFPPNPTIWRSRGWTGTLRRRTRISGCGAARACAPPVRCDSSIHKSSRACPTQRSRSPSSAFLQRSKMRRMSRSRAVW